MQLETSFTECHGVQHRVPCHICSQVGLNSVLSREEDQETSRSEWSADLAWCPTCSLVQWTETASGDGKSHGPSPTGRDEAAARSIVERLSAARQLGPDSLVVELVGADRDLLQWYHQAGIPVLGVQSLRNGGASRGHGKEIRAIHEAFSPELALELVRANQRADVIHSNSTIAHIADLNGVVSGFATLLKRDGILVIEVPYLKDLANHVGFNTLDRDELFYFSLTSLAQLLGQHGLEVVDVERLKMNGGVLRVIAARSGVMSATVAVHDLMDDEADWIRDPEFYQAFGETLLPSLDDRRAA